MSEKLEINLDNFTGPFDLLLKLIEKKKIDIYDINLEDITNPFLEEIGKLDKDLDEISEFIYIASILLTIKSNKLLPKEESSSLEEDLINYLIEYKKIKSVEDDFKFLEQEARKIHTKYQEDLTKFYKEEEIPIKKDISLLSKYFTKLLKNNMDSEKSSKIVKKNTHVDINEYIEKLRKTLNFSKKIKLRNITENFRNKEECIATFLALLELVRLREIELVQDGADSFELIKR